MKITERLIGAFFGDLIEAKVTERLKAASVLDAPTEAGWRKLTGNPDRNLLPTTQDRMIEIAYWLYETNPLARWYVDITVAFILGEGLPYEAEDDDVKDALDDFWFDPINRMDLYFPKHCRELHIYGELCLPVFTAQNTGKVRLGFIDPAQIAEVYTDPENIKMVIGVAIKGSTGTNDTRKLVTILPKDAEYVLSRGARAARDTMTDGECFFYAINNVTNSPRGRSDYLPIADWLDAYEQFLFDYADKWPQLNAFVWDMLVTGGTDKEIREQLANFSKKSGSVFGHNDKVTLTAVTPDLKALEAEKGARLFRNHILGRKGFPEHWYGGGGEVNLATAGEMGTPTYKMLSLDQKEIKYILEDIFTVVIDRRRQANTLRITDEEALRFTVSTPELISKDITKNSSAITQVAAALTTAETQGWIDKEAARKVFGFIVGMLGIEIDLDEARDNLNTQKEEKGYEDYVAPKSQKTEKGYGE